MEKWMELGYLCLFAGFAFIFYHGPEIHAEDISADLSPLPKLEPNHRLSSAQLMFENQLTGPESIVVDEKRNRIYSSLNDGRIIFFPLTSANDLLSTTTTKAQKPSFQTLLRTGEDYGENCGTYHFEPLCGRPLGMRLDSSGDKLIVCDAYKGLLSIDLQAEAPKVQVLVTEVDGKSLTFPNDLDIDQENSIVYFSDSSGNFTRRDVLVEVLEASATGRVLAYDLQTSKSWTVKDNLRFPNGITFVPDTSEVYVASTTVATIFAIHVKTGELRVVNADLPGLPDNLRMRQPQPQPDQQQQQLSKATSMWVTCGSRRSQPFSLAQLLSGHPKVRNLVARIFPASWILASMPLYGLVIEMHLNGTIIQTLQDPTGRLSWLSEAEEHEGVLYLGSWKNGFMGVWKGE
eukprot:m.18016 g.18016  ORF g.18016 m.18016 type:complete len:404 (-) comp11602_c0_seq1:19-1230(-)